VPDLEQFYRWKRDPANASAYEATERAWSSARDLGSDADIKDALAEVIARPFVAHRRFGRPFAYAVALSAAFAVLLAVWIFSRPSVLETGVGEQRVVRLADGSRVRLDTNSRVTVSLGRERRISLERGQALFEVAKDAAHPFVVSAAGAEVRALGTEFAVRRGADRNVSVVLVHGTVRVDDSLAGRVLLHPGQTVSVVAGAIGNVRATDLEIATSWTSGRLVFRDMPLAGAVAEMNRYGAATIILDRSPKVPMLVNGSFDSGDTEAFVAATEAIFGLRADRRTLGVIHLIPKSEDPLQ
jgi:transmembrane sensor